MDCRKFEITIISATDLENVRALCKMKVHARVSMGGDTEKRTPTDTHGEVNPAWNFTMRYTVQESTLQNYNTMLVIKLYCARKMGDRYIGEVNAPMKELFDCARPTGGSAVLTFPVNKGCLVSQGVLRFSYRFGEKVMLDKLLLAESIASWSRC